jgi:hypothetical protein
MHTVECGASDSVEFGEWSFIQCGVTRVESGVLGALKLAAFSFSA